MFSVLPPSNTFLYWAKYINAMFVYHNEQNIKCLVYYPPATLFYKKNEQKKHKLAQKWAN
jgi:hypothetical protein